MAEVYKELQKQGLSPDHGTFVALIRMYALQRDHASLLRVPVALREVCEAKAMQGGQVVVVGGLLLLLNGCHGVGPGAHGGLWYQGCVQKVACPDSRSGCFRRFGFCLRGWG